ncbi:hypothetical protein DPMN_105873 [Dreissena polymorpha]|uniref:Uncharacterized protein n=2 Tax=Dreissena polymorpha TaxID=45954 RepID=A0A9D4K3Y8_DREPO|nr:hypothetical protein DPMN_105873 [Dreissena polymorpha]
MKLIDADTGLETTAPILGKKVKIRSIYNFDSNALAVEYPRGLHNFDLTVGPDSGTSPRMQLVNEAG